MGTTLSKHRARYTIGIPTGVSDPEEACAHKSRGEPIYVPCIGRQAGYGEKTPPPKINKGVNARNIEMQLSSSVPQCVHRAFCALL